MPERTAEAEAEGSTSSYLRIPRGDPFFKRHSNVDSDKIPSRVLKVLASWLQELNR
ncbi:hypothetical protein ASPWEDRAFT_36572 [Aspergillus wentii DTO 134E9]|uniref:Uncharacterized protein n=1 Tax=Aspergillus wentii DTO 134E9 TaxID=1073089 RepID=A0A1L9RVD1_ASPWE|nr:uncharacterized protein ASPWEDRAFT_36572 [Aspergillus wentii DTO 134E9]OJJ38886.1 hypothetical protein ASPWEDRAFT_36572 [Aspergillus wentii DTO 134E9]